MALNGTPWHFERLTVQAEGLQSVVSHKSLDWDYEKTGEIVTDSTGKPRGIIRGPYEGTAKIELATQEAFDFLEALAEEGGDEVTVTFTYAPIEGDSRTLTLFLWNNKGSATEKKGEESMLTLEFMHTDYAQIDGTAIVPDEAAA